MGDPKPQQAFHINFSTITVLVLVLGAIFELYRYTASVNDAAGYERGKHEVLEQQAKEKQDALQQQINDIKAKEEQKALINKANKEIQEQNK